MSEALNLFNTKKQSDFLKKIQQAQNKQKKFHQQNKNILKIQSQIRRYLSNKKSIAQFMVQSESKLRSLVVIKPNYDEQKYVRMVKNALYKMPFIFQNISFINVNNYIVHQKFIVAFAQVLMDNQSQLINYLLNSQGHHKHLFLKAASFIISLMHQPGVVGFVQRFFSSVNKLKMDHQVFNYVLKPYNFENLWEATLTSSFGESWKQLMVQKVIQQEITKKKPFDNISFVQTIHQSADITLNFINQLSQIAMYFFNDPLSIRSELQKLKPQTIYPLLCVSYVLLSHITIVDSLCQINLILSTHKLLLQKYTEKMIKQIKHSIYKKVLIETAQNKHQIRQNVRLSIRYSQLLRSINHPSYFQQLFQVFCQMLKPSFLKSSQQQSNALIQNVCSIYIRLLELFEVQNLRYLCSRDSILLINNYMIQNKIRFGFVDQNSFTSKIIHLYVFMLNHYFSNMDDFQFTNPSLTFSKDFILDLIKSLHKLIIFIVNKKKHSSYIQQLFENITSLMMNIYNKNSRCQYFDSVVFTGQETSSQVNYSLLKISTKHEDVLPFVILPFNSRYDSFQDSLDYYRYYNGEAQVSIRRGFEFTDAFAQLHKTNMNSRLRVSFITMQGNHKIVEQGVDAGGLTKQFLNRVLLNAFSPDTGLFIELESRDLIPNPDYDQSSNELYKFVGKLVAKAILNKSLVPMKLSNCFLNLFLGKKNTIEDLRFIDKSFYDSMMKIKHSNQDICEMELTFSYYDGDKLILLKEKGDQIPVTNQNKLEFIRLLADYKTNRLYANQSHYFRKGFQTLIPADLFLNFNFNELNMIISGRTADFDVKDFKRNAIIHGFQQDSETIKHFWRVVDEMTNAERIDLLKYTTSCERPPILGFKDLSPKFKVAKLEQNNENIKNFLPRASTCVNTLYLPDYQDYELLKKKLLYAIKQNTGFGTG